MAVRLEDIGKTVRETQYAVRGPIVARAANLEREGREIIYCNIGNPQSLGQKPLTWIRQILALISYPDLLITGKDLFPADVIEMAKYIIRQSKYGFGAYTDSKGLRFIREAVANFIEKRDGITADPETIYLTDGASKGVQAILEIMISSPHDGIMVSIPQYPLYSATITMYGGRRVDYYLDEATGWKLTLGQLEEAYLKAGKEGIRVRAICVINPGNPTGAVLDEKNIEMVINFARKHHLAILADEVYQDNIYLSSDSFISFAKVLEKHHIKDVSLFSFHSCSKGLLGECGIRGGYFECRNIPGDVLLEITKMRSVSLCANTVGQVTTFLMVSPPQPGKPSFDSYTKERSDILESLRVRARLVAEGLNQIPGITCQHVAGAMYAFPKITLPPGMTDDDYCMRLLEETGICVVPGSGFGQAPGTFHFRTTILPPIQKIGEVIKKLAAFQLKVMR
ncbi:MAG: aminotransferase class I/II-fold pyridoxal phosphate-dependent enzyme [bacterium]